MAEKKEEKKIEASETEQALIDENENLIKELETANKSAEEYKDKWVRSVAEFDNFKKRNAKIWQEGFDEGRADLLLKILPIGDNLDMALTMNLDEKTAEGIKLIRRKYDETLKAIGVEEINPVGEQFDPNVAEAVMQAEKQEGEDSDTVKQVFEKGYKLKDKIIRYAKVSVIK